MIRAIAFLAFALLALPVWGARDFDGASTQYIEGSSAPRNSAPVTISAWFRPGNVTAFLPIAAQYQSSSSNDSFRLDARGDLSGDRVQFLQLGGGSNAFAESAGSYSADTWHHAAGVSTGTNHRIVYLDGTPGTANTTTISAPTGANRVGIGTWQNGISSGRVYFTGELGEVAIWNVALTEAEIVSLARGVSALRIRPSALVFYAPLWRDIFDYRAGLTLTNNGSTTSDLHPRRYR